MRVLLALALGALPAGIVWVGCSVNDSPSTLAPAAALDAGEASSLDGLGTPRAPDGADASDPDALSSKSPPKLVDLFNGAAHFVPDQHPAPVPGNVGHREAYAVERIDLGPDTLFLYHRCFSYPGKLSVDICLDVSSDGGKTFPTSHGIVVHNSMGAFAVAPSVILIGATWTMVWEEGGTQDGTYWATSTDGISWTNHGSLFGGSVYNATPSLYQFQNVVYVFAAQRQTADTLGITFHSGPSMSNLVQYGGGFVLTGSSSWNGGSVSMPRVVFQDNFHWMIFEGATKNLNCGATSAEQNDYGWGVARSTSLTTWEQFPGNPILQGDDAETCGFDMPQPVLRKNGDFFVYHTSDDTVTVQRDTLAYGSACAKNQLKPNWQEKNYVCMPSCGGSGGTGCYQTKDCATGTEVTPNVRWPGMTFDCVSCCK